MKKRKKRGPYRCTKCREYGHRADKCAKKHKMQVILDSLPGEQALGALIPEFFQIIAVVEGQTGEGLRGAIEGAQKLVAQGLPENYSLVNAWGELSKRAAVIPQHAIEAARAARVKLLEAETEYARACAPIYAALGHKRPNPSYRHPLKIKPTESAQ